MKPAYPELVEAAAFIGKVIQNEELRFRETLDTGLRLLNDSLAQLRSQGRSEIPGELIFKLYDTYGFPADIVRDVIRDSGMVMDTRGFETHMEAQRTRSRSKVAFDNLADAYKSLSAQAVRPEFHGYQTIKSFIPRAAFGPRRAGDGSGRGRPGSGSGCRRNPLLC